MKSIQTNLKNVSVHKFVNHILVPTWKAEKSLHPQTIDKYQRAARMLRLAIGREPKCREVDAAMVARLVECMERDGRSTRQTKTAEKHIRMIIRLWDPRAFIYLTGRAKGHMKPRRKPYGDGTLLATIYRERYERIVQRSNSESCRRLYRITLSMFDLFLGRPAYVTDLNDDTVSAFASWRKECGRAKKTVNRDLVNLLAIWRWLHNQRIVDLWPDVMLEKPPVRTPIALMQEEVNALMQAIADEDLPVGDVPGPVFWRALVLVIWDTAERIGAVRALQWSQVDLARGWVRFAAEDRKGGAEDNTLRLAKETCESLRQLRGHIRNEESVFPWPFHPCYMWQRYARIVQRAGLPDRREYKFHALRKTVASYYEAAGGNATALLKHSARKVTEVYLDPRIVNVASPVELLFRPQAAKLA